MYLIDVTVMGVETAAEECICVATLDVFIDVTVMGEGDDSDSGELTCVTTSIIDYKFCLFI